MLRISKEPQTVSEQEEAARFAEGRKVTAENEVVILGQNKKKIEEDLQKIKEDIQVGNQTIQKNNEEINNTNEQVLEVQNTFRSEKQKFDSFVKERIVLKDQIEEDIKKGNIEKSRIDFEILTASKEHEFSKLNKIQELKNLEDKKTIYNSDIKKISEDKLQVISEINNFQNKLDGIKEETKKANDEKNSLEKDVTNLKGEVENQKGIIQNNKVILSQQDSTIITKNNEIDSLVKKIEEKNIEYKSVEQKAFVILQKQDALNQKEAFIKSQYERAGIKWEE
jgi:chromosome segregation ATPase